MGRPGPRNVRAFDEHRVRGGAAVSAASTRSHFSYRGSEFLSARVRQHLCNAHARQSMTRGGAPGENAHMESFFHSLKADGIHGRTFQTVRDLRLHLRHYLRYYNHQRLHSALGYQSPIDYERRAA